MNMDYYSKTNSRIRLAGLILIAFCMAAGRALWGKTLEKDFDYVANFFTIFITMSVAAFMIYFTDVETKRHLEQVKSVQASKRSNAIIKIKVCHNIVVVAILSAVFFLYSRLMYSENGYFIPFGAGKYCLLSFTAILAAGLITFTYAYARNSNRHA